MFNVVVLGVVSFLTDVSSEMVYPLLPVFLTVTMGASPALLGVIEGVAESLASLLKVFSGYAGDKTRRKKELAIAGYSSSMLGKVILITSVSWAGVLLSRVVDRFGKGIRTAPRDAIIADAADSARRGHAFGLHRAMDTFGAITGVTIAYFLLEGQAANFKSIFMYSTIPALLGVMALFLVRQPKKIKAENKKFSFAWSRLDGKLKAFLILAFIFTLGNSSNQFLLLRASDLGMPTTTILLLYLVYNISYGVLSYPAGRFSDKVGRKRVLVAGYLIYALVYFGFALVNKSSSLWLLFAVYGIYIAFTEGVEKALLVDIAPDQLRGTVIGLHASLVGIGLLPASMLAGFLWSLFGARVPFYFGGFMGILAAIGLLVILRDRSAGFGGKLPEGI